MQLQTALKQAPRSLRICVIVGAAISALIMNAFIERPQTQNTKITTRVEHTQVDILVDLPTVGLATSVIQTVPPFAYTYLAVDADSYQVADQTIRALEPGLTALWGRLVGPCCTNNGHVVDIGSHFGYYSLYSAALGCTFTAIEPVNKFRAILRMNLQTSSFASKGVVHGFAAGNQTRPIGLQVPESGVLGIAHVEESNVTANQQSQERRLDDEVDFGHLEICGLKIDVEGYEPYALAGSDKLLRSRKVPFIMMEFSPSKMGKNDVALENMLATLHSIGYTAFEVEWGKAKLAKPPATIDTTDFEKNIVDISSHSSRLAFTAKVLGYTNTNLWLSLKNMIK